MRSQRALAAVLVLVMAMGSAVAPVTAQPSAQPRDLEDSIGFMYVSTAVTDEQVAKPKSPLRIDRYPGSTAVEKMLNATKDEMRQLKRGCEQAKQDAQRAGQSCELERITNYCAASVATLELRIKQLRKIRGDKRKAFTKAWHRIGPLGRQLLRGLANEALAVVVSGGTLRHGVLRSLAKRRVLRTGKDAALVGLARSVRGKAVIAEAAGTNACGPAASVSPAPASPQPLPTTSDLVFDSVCGVGPEVIAAGGRVVAPPPPYEEPAVLVYLDWPEKADVQISYGLVQDAAMYQDREAVKDPGEAAVSAGCGAGTFDAGSIDGCWPGIPLVLTEAQYPGAWNWAQSSGAYSLVVQAGGACWFRAGDDEVDWDRIHEVESRAGELEVAATVAYYHADQQEPYRVDPPLSLSVPRGPTSEEAMAAEGPIDPAPYRRFVELLDWDPSATAGEGAK